MGITLCLFALAFNLSNFLLLHEYMEVSQGAKEGRKKEEICICSYITRG